MTDRVRIATRASQLALWQAHHVADRLRAAWPKLEVEVVHVSTTGDRVQQTSLRQFGGQGVFTREVQTSVLEGQTDIAVHSLKDLPTVPTEGLVLAAVPERAPVEDVLVLPLGTTAKPTNPNDPLSVLPHGARIGSGSPRRQAQLLHRRSDLNVSEIRGNVDTRLKKLDAGEYDAILLAAAGLTRLGWADRISHRLKPPFMLPAAGQGALGLECRRDDERTFEWLYPLFHHETYAAVTAERFVLSTLRAGCHAPVGTWARIEGEQLVLDAVLLSLDGKIALRAHASTPLKRDAENPSEFVWSVLADAPPLGVTVAEDLLDQGGGPLVNPA